jgi:AhpD family alkylhydroperoxidase
MSKDFKDLVKHIGGNVAKLHKAQPDVMKAFGALGEAAGKDGALDKKSKECIALGIAVALRCEGCIGFHTQKLVKLGMSEAELMEILSMAVYMGGGPSVMYAAEAIQAFEDFNQA